MNTQNLTPNYTAAQLVSSTDLIRLAGVVDWQDGYLDIAIISNHLIQASYQNPQLKRAMDRLAEKILAEEDRHYTAMAADYSDHDAIRHKQAA
jgi:hypothetical protein